MAKSCLGIDIGKDQLKLVLMKGETIQKTASVQMPEGLLKDAGSFLWRPQENLFVKP